VEEQNRFVGNKLALLGTSRMASAQGEAASGLYAIVSGTFRSCCGFAGGSVPRCRTITRRLSGWPSIRDTSGHHELSGERYADGLQRYCLSPR